VSSERKLQTGGQNSALADCVLSTSGITIMKSS